MAPLPVSVWLLYFLHGKTVHPCYFRDKQMPMQRWNSEQSTYNKSLVARPLHVLL